GGVGADEIAFLLLGVGQHRQRTGSRDAVAGRTGGLQQLVDLTADVREVALLDACLGAREPEPRSSLVGSVFGQDGERLLVATLRAWPRLDLLGAYGGLLQGIDGARAQIGWDAFDPTQLADELCRDAEVVRDRIDGFVVATTPVGQPSSQRRVPAR